MLQLEYLSEEGEWLSSAQSIFNEDGNAIVDQVYHKSKSCDRGSNVPTRTI